jgi:hypothetical protein
VFDPTDPAHNAVLTFAREPGAERRVRLANRISCRYRDGRPRAVVPWMVPTSGAKGAKDLAVLLEQPAGVFRVWRARLRDGEFQLDAAPLSETQVDPEAGLVAVRRSPLDAGETPMAHARPQDLVARSRANPGELLVFQAGAGNEVVVTPVLVGGFVFRLHAAAANDDGLEDLLLLQVDFARAVLTVVCRVQHPDPQRGLLQPAEDAVLLQFAPFGGDGAVVRGFHFDRSSPRLAEGILMLTDTMGNRSEIRYVKPAPLGDGRLTASMVRSPLAIAVPGLLELTSVDVDGDGLADTVAGSPNGVLKVDRGARR